MKKALLAAVSILLVAVLALGGTLAYLLSEDEDVNVMVVGNVKIEQLEYERVVDENGDYISTGKTDEYGYTPDDLQEYTQDKVIIPAVYDKIEWADDQQSWDEVGAPGSNQLFNDDIKNVQDKFVFVKNTGSVDAYYRTVIAVECPEGFDDELLHLNISGNERFTWTEVGFTTIDGVRYVLYEALYNEVLVPDEVSRPSLLQVFLGKEATNEDVALFDGILSILAVSQGVQADGFDSAKEALDEAFGATAVDNHPWVGRTNVVAKFITTEDELLDGGTVAVKEDIVLTNESTCIDVPTIVDLRGNTITSTRPVATNPTMLSISTIVVSGTEVVFDGDGSVINDHEEAGYAISVADGATVTIKNGTYASGHDALYVKEGTLNIEGGFFYCTKDADPAAKKDYSQITKDYSECHPSTVINCQDDNYVVGKCVVNITGGTFVNMDPSNVHEGRLHNESFVAEGYKVVAETQSNGDVWYTVVAE